MYSFRPKVQADQRPQGGQNKITKMMAIVLGAYLICYIPQVIIILATKRPYTGLIIIMERVIYHLYLHFIFISEILNFRYRPIVIQ